VPLERVSQGFKDISMTFQSNPLTSDLIALKNENAIARSIRNIVFTIPGEKFFNESFGSNINRSLFDNIDELSALIIKDQITESIENFEPRVDTVKVVTSPDFDNNSFDVVLTYEIIGADIPPQELQFVLQQTR
jgi:phage baseplate assembly protein W|tara:strand:+ start:1866 stop:2267 length:402 start_codon:yes stop_codon:yes gene_type:complete